LVSRSVVGMSLLLLLLPLVSSSTAALNFPGVDYCQYFDGVAGLPQLRSIPDLNIIVDDEIDIHEAALSFHRLMCVYRHHSSSSSPILFIRIPSNGRSLLFWARKKDPYDFFVRNFNKTRTNRQDLCSVARKTIWSPDGPTLLFTGLSTTYISCPGADNHPLFHLIIGQTYTMIDTDRKRYRLNVHHQSSIRPVTFELAFRLADEPLNSTSSINTTSVLVKRIGLPVDSREGPRFLISLIYVFGLLVSIFILFFSLLSLVNVNEHYHHVLGLLIQQRVNRQRALMENNQDEGEEVEEAEEEAAAIEPRAPRRRIRLNSEWEERSLLGTDEHTIRTALSGRFPSLSSLSFHSVDSRPRRTSLNSLEGVTVEPSNVVTTSSDAKTEKSEKK
ncbi:hypothetical protein PENTCL1PPCAC_3635, partial [Pristionchus entomophagus]